MFNFDLEKTAIYHAIKWEGFPIFKFAKTLKKSFFALFIVVLLTFLYGFISENFSRETSKIFLGLSIISFVFFISARLTETFFNSKLKKPKLEIILSEAVLNPEAYNSAGLLSFEAAKAVYRAINFSRRMKFPRVPSEAL